MMESARAVAGLTPPISSTPRLAFCDLDHRHLQFLRDDNLRGGLKATPYPVAANLARQPNAVTSPTQILELKGIANIKVITGQLEDALTRQDGAFQRRHSARYAAAAATAEDARSALASVPALTLAELLAKAKAFGPVPQLRLPPCRQANPLLSPASSATFAGWRFGPTPTTSKSRCGADVAAGHCRRGPPEDIRTAPAPAASVGAPNRV